MMSETSVEHSGNLNYTSSQKHTSSPKSTGHSMYRRSIQYQGVQPPCDPDSTKHTAEKRRSSLATASSWLSGSMSSDLASWKRVSTLRKKYPKSTEAA